MVASNVKNRVLILGLYYRPMVTSNSRDRPITQDDCLCLVVQSVKFHTYHYRRGSGLVRDKDCAGTN